MKVRLNHVESNEDSVSQSSNPEFETKLLSEDGSVEEIMSTIEPLELESAEEDYCPRMALRSESLELLENSIGDWELRVQQSLCRTAVPAVHDRGHYDLDESSDSSYSEDDQAMVQEKGLFSKRRFDTLSVSVEEANVAEPKRSRRSKDKKRRESATTLIYPANDPTVKTTTTYYSSAPTQHPSVGSINAVRVSMPHAPEQQKKSMFSSGKRDKRNPYEGNTPRTPVDIVMPNEQGVYNFTPSAAAFKWNWSLLDVRARPVGGMSPTPTPTNGFKMFRETFAVTPIATQTSVANFLLNPPKKKAILAQKDGLPEFPTNRKAAKAVRKRNLTFSPRGHAKGKEVECAYNPIYDALVSRGGHEPSAFQIEGQNVTSAPEIRARHLYRSSSSASLIDVEEPIIDDERYRPEYSPLIKTNRAGRTTSSKQALGSHLYKYHVAANAINASICLTCAFVMNTNTVIGSDVRRLSTAPTPLTTKALIIWSIGMILAFVYESIRVAFLYANNCRMKIKREPDNPMKGNIILSMQRSLLSSSAALGLMSVMSLMTSCCACLGFTMINKSGEGFLAKESRSFMWTIGLIHTGVTSGLLTKRLFSERVKIAMPAFQLMGRNRLMMSLGCLIPAAVGWFGTRMVAQLVHPTWHLPETAKGATNSYDFISVLFTMIMSFLEYFEAMGFWKVCLSCAITAFLSVLLLDFVDLSITLTNEYYRHGVVKIEQDQEGKYGNPSSMNYKLFMQLLVQGALATGLASGSFWQWPINAATLVYYKMQNDDTKKLQA